MAEIIALAVERPDVVCVVIASMALCAYERGAARAAIWLASGTFIGWAVEASSTRTGFPFGMYVYHQDVFPEQLWIAGVPLFASLSLAGLAYFAYSVARRLVGRGWPTLVVAALSMMWMDTVIDPVTHLGAHWWLRDLYHYDPAGVHFGVPLSNYFGWFFTGLCIVGFNQLVDRRLAPRDLPDRSRHLALACQLGTYLYMIAVTLYLMSLGVAPAAMLLSGITLTVGYATFVKLVQTGAMSRQAKSHGH